MFALLANGTRRELELESFWPHKARLILKFAGVDTISDAEALIGAEIQIPARERANLEAGVQYISDLVGCSVSAKAPEFPAAQELGTVEQVQFGAGEAPLLVIRKGNQEHLIPFAAEYIAAVDVDRKRIELVLPEGMLEINSPLTAEEKKRQGLRSAMETGCQTRTKNTRSFDSAPATRKERGPK